MLRRNRCDSEHALENFSYRCLQNKCCAGTVVTVNMLGKLLRVRGTYFYMCPCCTGIRVWLGDGSDLNEHECICWQFGSVRSAVLARYNQNILTKSSRSADVVVSSCSMAYCGPTYSAPCCMVCKTKNLCNRGSMILPDVQRKVMRRIGLCNRHAPPEHILAQVSSFDELELALKAFCFSSSSSISGGGRRGRGSSGIGKAAMVFASRGLVPS